MHEIQRHAQFAREVSRLLSNAASEGQIKTADEALTGDERLSVDEMGNEGFSADEVAEILITERQERYAVDALAEYGTGIVEDESYRSAIIDSGRGRLLR